MLYKGLSAVKVLAVLPAALCTVRLSENISSDLCGICHGSWDLQREGRWEGGREGKRKGRDTGKVQKGGGRERKMREEEKQGSKEERGREGGKEREGKEK